MSIAWISRAGNGLELSRRRYVEDVEDLEGHQMRAILLMSTSC